jgi:hypothetical protein
MHKRYQRIPAPFSAIQWDGTNTQDVIDLVGEHCVWMDHNQGVTGLGIKPTLSIQLEKILLVVSVSNFVILTDTGQVDTCKADYFLANNEEITNV